MGKKSKVDKGILKIKTRYTKVKTSSSLLEAELILNFLKKTVKTFICKLKESKNIKIV
jgi:hypothetical protein